MNMLDMEENHEKEEVDIEALIRKIESQEGRLRAKGPRKEPGVPSDPGVQTCNPEPKYQPVHFHRLTEYKNKQGACRPSWR